MGLTSDKMIFHFESALDHIAEITNRYRTDTKELYKFTKTDYHFNVRGYAYFKIAEIYKKAGARNKAIKIYQKVINEFPNISLDGDGNHLKDSATHEIQELKGK